MKLIMYLFGLGVRKFKMELEPNRRWWATLGGVWHLSWCRESLHEDSPLRPTGVKIRWTTPTPLHKEYSGHCYRCNQVNQHTSAGEIIQIRSPWKCKKWKYIKNQTVTSVIKDYWCCQFTTWEQIVEKRYEWNTCIPQKKEMKIKERQWPDIVSDEQISYWVDTVCHVPVSSRFWSVVYFLISSEIFVYFYSLMMVMYTIITWIMKQEGLIHWKW